MGVSYWHTPQFCAPQNLLNEFLSTGAIYGRVAPLNVSGMVYSETMKDKKTELTLMLAKYARAGIPLTPAERNLVKYLLSKQ